MFYLSRHKNPRLNRHINPNLNRHINPRLNRNINPNLNRNINPNLNRHINPRLNRNINPSLNRNISPNLNRNINPRLNRNINPVLNRHINPNINYNYNGQFAFDLSLNPTEFIVDTGNGVIQFFNQSLANTRFGIRNAVNGFVIYDLQYNYIGHLVPNGAGGYNQFTPENVWTGLVN